MILSHRVILRHIKLEPITYLRKEELLMFSSFEYELKNDSDQQFLGQKTQPFISDFYEISSFPLVSLILDTTYGKRLGFYDLRIL